MPSERQIAANRLNAQASSGPRTEKGKARSSRNAFTHGLTARSGLLAGEDPEEYRRLREEAIAQLRPEGVLELELVERMVSVFWRLRRVPAFEAALMAWLEKSADDEVPTSLVGKMTGDLWLGLTVKELLRSDLSGKLSRYETSLQRQTQPL